VLRTSTRKSTIAWRFRRGHTGKRVGQEEGKSSRTVIVVKVYFEKVQKRGPAKSRKGDRKGYVQKNHTGKSAAAANQQPTYVEETIQRKSPQSTGASGKATQDQKTGSRQIDRR